MSDHRLYFNGSTGEHIAVMSSGKEITIQHNTDKSCYQITIPQTIGKYLVTALLEVLFNPEEDNE